MNARANQYLTRWAEHVAIANDVLQSLPMQTIPKREVSALEMRQSVLGKGHPFVELHSLLNELNGHGVPVVRTSCSPDRPLIGLVLTQDARAVIVLSDNHSSPSRMACDLAHLAGHVFLGHLGRDDAIGDVTIDWTNRASCAEREANEFALTLLTGRSVISLNAKFFRDHALADWAHRQAAKHRISPAIVIQLYARQTGKVPLANRACKAIESAAIG